MLGIIPALAAAVIDGALLDNSLAFNKLFKREFFPIPKQIQGTCGTLVSLTTAFVVSLLRSCDACDEPSRRQIQDEQVRHTGREQNKPD